MDLPRVYTLQEHYQDEGCELAPSCLNCPFSRCVEDIPRERQHQRKEIRNREISRLFYTEGIDMAQIAQRLSISKRTVQRALKEKGLSDFLQSEE